MEILRRGGSALDAVEAACRVVEDNLDDHSVGTGGYPNRLGEVELDASLMEGTTRRAGAVAALQNYRTPSAWPAPSWTICRSTFFWQATGQRLLRQKWALRRAIC